MISLALAVHHKQVKVQLSAKAARCDRSNLVSQGNGRLVDGTATQKAR